MFSYDETATSITVSLDGEFVAMIFNRSYDWLILVMVGNTGIVTGYETTRPTLAAAKQWVESDDLGTPRCELARG